ncbi:MAG TPA: hypothetical protein VFJ63_01815, partial [Candidatus Bathyarchaeia archaeon]|nr:hypothetical protein [Candidatus Bathyarchaeia archaeon]
EAFLLTMDRTRVSPNLFQSDSMPSRQPPITSATRVPCKKLSVVIVRQVRGKLHRDNHQNKGYNLTLQLIR